MVMIPSTEPLSTTQVGETPFFLLTKGEDEKRAGIDMAVDNDGDLVFTSSNDLQLSYGLTNALQAMKLKMVTELGQNLRHTNYGLPVAIGRKTSNPDDTRQLLITGINDMIKSDQRFDRIETLNVRIDGSVVLIELVVRLAGTGTMLPISFTINTG
jgi:hypothetical protein